MANSYLIDLGINDPTQDIVRKCNSNFRRLYKDLNDLSNYSVRREKDRAEQALDDAVTAINTALQNAITAINNHIAQVKQDLDARIDYAEQLIQQLEDLLNRSQSDQDDAFDELKDSIADIIYGAYVSGNRIRVPSGTKVPTGNINLFSVSTSNYIRTRAGTQNNDLKGA